MNGHEKTQTFYLSKILAKRATAPLFCMVIEVHMQFHNRTQLAATITFEQKEIGSWLTPHFVRNRMAFTHK